MLLLLLPAILCHTNSKFCFFVPPFNNRKTLYLITYFLSKGLNNWDKKISSFERYVSIKIHI